MRILDLFAGAGGAAFGYHLAFPDAQILGVDIMPQPNFPFTLVVADALVILEVLDLAKFDLVHASPPCQGYTTMSNRWRGNGGPADQWPKLIAHIREALQPAGAWVIENVGGARSAMRHPVCLTGGMFGLGVERPRLFETSFPVPLPARSKVQNPIGVYGRHHDGRRLWTRKDGTHQRAARTLEEGRAAMGIDWMEWRELAESIPPAYTAHIGRAYTATLQGAAA
jgi:DNA (cytosine-5)-methyltransferase 1